MSHFLRRPKAQTEEPVTGKITSPVEKELTIFADIVAEIQRKMSRPPEGDMPCTVLEPGEHEALKQNFDQGRTSRNKLHHLIAGDEANVARDILSRYEEEKEQFNRLECAYKQPKRGVDEKKKKEKSEDDAGMLKRMGEGLKRLGASK